MLSRGTTKGDPKIETAPLLTDVKRKHRSCNPGCKKEGKPSAALGDDELLSREHVSGHSLIGSS